MTDTTETEVSPVRRYVLVPLLALAAVVSMLVPARPVGADTVSRQDGRGDSADSRSDITYAGAVYENGFVALALVVASPEHPLHSPWWSQGGFVEWRLDTNNDPYIDYSIKYTAPGGVVSATVSDFKTSRALCQAEPKYDGVSYWAGFPASCIGSPTAFWFLGMAGYGGTTYDYGPGTGLCCKTVEGEAQPASGYWMVTEAGFVHAFGDARWYGESYYQNIDGTKAVDIESTPSGEGYWTVSSSGLISSKGDAKSFGIGLYNTNRLQPGEKVTSMSATPTGQGLWLFTDRGRVFPFGDAPYLEDMSGKRLNAPVLDSVGTPSGRGYYMVAADGGIFTFGDARFRESMGGKPLNKPVISMAPDPDGVGYWLVASDGGIFAFDAPFYGSMGRTPLNKPISGMVTGPAGYLMVAEDGGIFSFGDVKFHGSLGDRPPSSPVAAVALLSH